MGATPIEWTDHSINPIRAKLGARVGHYCEKVSPGCKNCYSSRLQPRFGLPQFQEQRGNADVVPFFDVSKLKEVLRRRKPTKFFWCDMTDMFGEWVPEGWIAACFAAMAATPWHTHQVLTKRAERMRTVVTEMYADDGARLVDAAEWLAGQISACHLGEDEWTFPLKNVWLMVSAEDQPRADERIHHLLATPAAVRGVSAEPLIGPLDLLEYLPITCAERAVRHHHRTNHDCSGSGAEAYCEECRFDFGSASLDWVIPGGESGAGARECQLAWVDSLVQQCADARTACFVKQLGKVVRFDREDDGQGLGWGPYVRFHEDDDLMMTAHTKGGAIDEWPLRLRVRQFPCPGAPAASGQTGKAGVGSDARPAPAGSSEAQ